VKGRIADDLLERLGEEWLAVQLDPHTLPEWLETREGPRPMSEDMWRLARKVREDVAAVHAALLAEEPVGGPTVEGVPSLSAASVAAAERAASSSAPRAGRSRRSHYLYWLLCRLEALGVLTFTLPVRTRELPPRALGFDALDPHLPLLTRFGAWQRHLASRSLDVRPLKGRNETSRREREYLTLAALFAFGGPCGRGALAMAARIRVEDVDLASGTVWLRDLSGTGSLT
jgi:hypothetical protein